MRTITALVVALVLVGGCGSDEPSLSETIEGVWVTDLFGKYEVFLEDGSYGVGNTVESATPVNGWAELDSGVWSVDGDILTRTPDERSEVCAGMVGTYEVEVLNGGDRLEITVLEDECELRAADFGSGLTRTPVVTDS